MSKLEEARWILNALQVPNAQQTDLCCHILLTLAGLREDGAWSSVSNAWMRIHDMIVFLRENYGIEYAENTRETVRKQALHHFRNAVFLEDNGKVTNSPNYRYRLTDEMLSLLRSYGSGAWDGELERFQDRHQSLIDLYRTKRAAKHIPIQVNGQEFRFSVGAHNQLQRAILEAFVPRFAPGSTCLYVGDSANRDLFKDEETLRELGLDITLHDKLPDVVLYSRDKNWLYFIEAVTSVGPMEPKRVMEMEAMTRSVKAGKIYVTAFPDFKTYRKFSASLAWETEVWIAEQPGHMIHLNGDRFLGPRR